MRRKAACACATSADERSHEHDRGPLEHPEPPRSVVGTTVGSNEGFPSNRGQPPELRRVRGREHRVSTLSAAIARGRDFAPTPIAPGTSCRRQRSLSCLEDAGRDRCRRRSAHLHGTRRVRVVRRRTSAKRSGVHQPEGPSIAGPLSCKHASGCAPQGASSGRPRFPRLFHHREPARGTLAQDPEARTFGRESGKHPAVRSPAAPPTTSAFE
jgi:hypothetical protein